MLFFRSYFFKGSETDLNKLVQKQLALNSTRVTLESSQANTSYSYRNNDCKYFNRQHKVKEYGWVYL